MKSLFFGLFVLCSQVSLAQSTLWAEDFEGEANGATNGTASGFVGGTWSVTTAPSGTFSKQNTFLFGNAFQIDNTGTEGVWQSNNFSIALSGMATISIDLHTALTNATDYVRAYYKVDGGPEILFAELLGQVLNITTNGSAIVSGNNLQIVIRGMDNTTGTFLGVPFSLYVDNLSITSAVVVYSRANTAWNVGTTWSTTGFTGASCGCTPTTSQVAIIGGGFTVDLTADALVGGVDIQNTGTLRYTAANLDLGIEAGLLRVRSGGTLNRNGQTSAQIDYNQNVGGATLQVDVGGTVTIEDVTLTANATNLHYFTGGGSLTIADDVLIGADGATLTNNMTSTLAITDRIEFSTGTNNSSFVNNGALTAATLFFDDDTNFFTNASTATFSANIAANGNADDNNTITNNNSSTLAFVNLDGDAAAATGDGGDMTILNSGTINQTGTFLDIPNNTNALNDINNLAGATWNYSGTGHDTNVRLFANNPTNTFNYNLSGAQQIITPVTTDGYNNLTLQSVAAAAKTALANFSVSGNYTRSGSATFTPGGFTVTLNGTTSAQTISAVGGETFAGLTINNTFGTSPQIITSSNVTVTGTLTMTSGIVNQSGNIFTLGSSGVASTLVRTASTTTNWMYGGSFRRFWLNATAISSTVAPLYGLFPVGTSSTSSYRPVTINSTVSPTATGSYTVTHTDVSGVTNLSPVFDDDPTAGVLNIVRKHNAQFVNVISGVTGGTYNIGVTMTGLLAGTLSDIRLGVSNGATTVTTVGTHATAIGTAPNPTANRTGVTLAGLSGDFRITTTNTAATPLPIELTYFSAVLKNSGVELSWSTASELNNDFFTVERSGGEKFEPVKTIEGKGTTTLTSNYQIFDEDPLLGTSYYRLKQTDFDGKFTYSSVKTIENNNPGLQFKIYPNPIADNRFTLEMNGLPNNIEVPVSVVNMQGVTVHQSTYQASFNGRLKAAIELNPLPSGVYMVVVNAATGLRKKIVIP
jgi:hypothetical protein